MDWYFANDGQRQGPVSAEAFARSVASGEVRADTLVWRAGMAAWQPWSEVQPTVELPAVEPLPPPLSPSELAPPSGHVAVGGPTALRSGEGRFGGFWLRLLAKILDAFALWLITNLIGMFLFHGAATEFQSLDPEDPQQVARFFAFMGKFALLSILVGLAYHWFFVAKFAATPGKLALGLRIVRPDGAALSHGQIVGRYFAEFISSFILYIGYLIAAFDEEKRALHDYICGTRVVKRNRPE